MEGKRDEEGEEDGGDRDGERDEGGEGGGEGEDSHRLPQIQTTCSFQTIECGFS